MIHQTRHLLADERNNIIIIKRDYYNINHIKPNATCSKYHPLYKVTNSHYKLQIEIKIISLYKLRTHRNQVCEREQHSNRAAAREYAVDEKCVQRWRKEVKTLIDNV